MTTSQKNSDKKNIEIGEMTDKCNEFKKVLGSFDLLEFSKARNLWKELNQEERTAVLSRYLVEQEKGKKNIDLLKQNICDLISSLNCDELYIFSSFLKDYLIFDKKEDLTKILFTCDQCKQRYGKCDETKDGANRCVKRFSNYCEQKIK